MSQFQKTVIPGEPKDCGRDPESRKVAENKIILDPGSHPASVFAEASPDRPRDLAGMTNYDTASKGGDFRDGLSAIEESDFITGQTIVVDGGATMH